jgi:hypothetical protein
MTETTKDDRSITYELIMDNYYRLSFKYRGITFTTTVRFSKGFVEADYGGLGLDGFMQLSVDLGIATLEKREADIGKES